jgi:hypothetical protein
MNNLKDALKALKATNKNIKLTAYKTKPEIYNAIIQYGGDLSTITRRKNPIVARRERAMDVSLPISGALAKRRNLNLFIEKGTGSAGLLRPSDISSMTKRQERASKTIDNKYKRQVQKELKAIIKQTEREQKALLPKVKKPRVPRPKLSPEEKIARRNARYEAKIKRDYWKQVKKEEKIKKKLEAKAKRENARAEKKAMMAAKRLKLY